MTSVRRSLAKRAAFSLLGNPLAFLARLRRIAASGVVTVLNLHRVAPFDNSGYPPLDPGLFRALVALCNKHFSVVTFAQLAKRDFDRPPLILSFDDGYRDFCDYAGPIMDEFGVVCNQNLIPASVASGRPPLNVILGDYIGRAPAEHLAALEIEGFRPYQAGMGRDRYATLASAHLKNNPIARQHELAEQILPQLQRTQEFKPAAMMTLAQVQEVARVHEIGMHSFEHASMEFESNDYLRADLSACASWMQSHLGQEMRIYALPNGSYRPEQLDIVRDAGVRHILLVGEDFTRNDQICHRFTFDAAGTAEMRFRAGGLRVRP